MPEIIVKLGDHEVQRLILDKDRIGIGRAGDNDVAIENLSISRHHAEIRRQEGQYYLIDLDSANGTYVNGVRVARTQLYHQDIVSLGKHKLHFLAPEAAMPAASPAEFERTMLMDKSAWIGCLTVEIAKQRKGVHSLSQPVTRVGRAADNDVRLVDWFVEPYQFEIFREKSGYRLKDVTGKRLTQLNGEAVDEKELKENDAIEVGNARMTFSLLEVGAAPAPFLRVPQEMEAAELEAAGVAAGPAAAQNMSPGLSEPTPTAGFRVEPEPTEATPTEAEEEEEPVSFDLELEEPALAASGPVEEVLLFETEPPEEVPSADMPVETGGEPSKVFAGVEELRLEEEVEAPPEAPPEEALEEVPAQVAEEASLGVSESEVPFEESPPPLAEIAASAALDEIEDELADVRSLPEFGMPEVQAPTSEDWLALAQATPQPEPAFEPMPEIDTAAIEAEVPEPAAPAPAAPEPVSDTADRTVAVLEKALTNPSRAVRKQAASRLKKLTGRDYDY